MQYNNNGLREEIHRRLHEHYSRAKYTRCTVAERCGHIPEETDRRRKEDAHLRLFEMTLRGLSVNRHNLDLETQYCEQLS